MSRKRYEIKGGIPESQYNKFHSILKKKFGKASRCENENFTFKNPKRFEWALKKDHEYSSSPEDYLQLCPSCHRKYDAKPFSESTIAKLRISNKLNSLKPILQSDLQGHPIKVWTSVNEAANAYGIFQSAISNNLTNRSTMAAGFKWTYYETK